MNNRTTFDIPKNLRKPLTEEEKQVLISSRTMNYECHHEISHNLTLDKPSLIARLFMKIFR